jgi:hypothetical protein
MYQGCYMSPQWGMFFGADYVGLQLPIFWLAVSGVKSPRASSGVPDDQVACNAFCGVGRSSNSDGMHKVILIQRAALLR